MRIHLLARSGELKWAMDNKDTHWIHGVNPVIERLRSNAPVQNIYIYRNKRGSQVRKIIEYAKDRRIPVEYVDKSFFSSFPPGHQGVAARIISTKRRYSLQDLYGLSASKREPPFYVIIEGITDPHNLGAIIRTAEVAGVHGIVLEKRRVASGMTVVKASAGAIEYIPIVRVSNIKHAIVDMKNEGIAIYGAEADGDLLYWDVDFKEPVAIVLGSEAEGLKPSVRNYCDSIIKIPVKGHINSLNVSVAAGVLIYEALRQRKDA